MSKPSFTAYRETIVDGYYRFDLPKPSPKEQQTEKAEVDKLVSLFWDIFGRLARPAVSTQFSAQKR